MGYEVSPSVLVLATVYPGENVYFTVTESKSMHVYKDVTKLKTRQTGFWEV